MLLQRYNATEIDRIEGAKKYCKHASRATNYLITL